MSPVELTAAVLLVVAAVLGARALTRRGAAKLRALPKRSIAELEHGLAKVAGHARLDGEPLLSPVTRTPCIAYRMCALSRYSGKRLARIVDREEGRSFWLVEGAARVRVELPPAQLRPQNPLYPSSVTTMAGVCLRLGAARRHRSEELDRADLQRILAWLGYASAPAELPWIFEETILEDGDLVTVAGSARASAFGDYRRAPEAPTLGAGTSGLLIERLPAID
jgi:hypothetical protein